MRANVSYDPEKFRELLVYVADRTGDDARFGDTKLNKVLFFADTRAWAQFGQAVTGARYQKLEHGPAPRALLPVRQALEKEGAVEVCWRGTGNWRQTVTVALRPARTELFTADELTLIDELIDELAPKSAAETSEWSHAQSPGWNLVDMREDIPYELSLISIQPPSDETLALGRELAARFAW